MASFVRLICQAEGRIGNLRVIGIRKTVYVNTLKILLVQTVTQADWKRGCVTDAEEFIDNMYDEQTDKYVFVRVERELLIEGATIPSDEYKKSGSIWFGVHKNDVKKLGLL